MVLNKLDYNISNLKNQMTPQDYDDYHLRLTLPSASLSSFETNKKKKIAEGELQVFTLP